MLLITKSAVVLLSLLALLPLAWGPMELAAVDCGVASAAPAASDCCCGPALPADDPCDCTAEPIDSGEGSPATPAPSSVRSALTGQVEMLVAVLGEDCGLRRPLAESFVTRAQGKLPPRLAHCTLRL